MHLATKFKKNTLKCGRFLMRIKDRTHVMGVLNVTPDSFSDGGKFLDEKAAIERALQMADEGADIIDIGAESTRPGSLGVSAEEELKRIIPVIKKLSKKLDIPISVDTSKHEVALRAMEEGASIINDITGLMGDSNMAAVVAKTGAAICVMHIKGVPGTMQKNPVYNDLISDVIARLAKSVDAAISAGVEPDKIIVDPGIGFGKTPEHNFLIIKELHKLEDLGKPILIGTSRKSFIGKVLDREADDRLMGTAATYAIAIMNGADIIRVHDVKEMLDVARIADILKNMKA